MKHLRLALVTLLFATSSVMAALYTVDASHSQVGFKVRHMMISTVNGKFDEFSGTFVLDKGVLKALNGTVMTTSINTGIGKRDDHLRSGDFFEAGKYPQMSLKLLKVDGDEAQTALTIRDVTKTVTFDLEYGGEITGPWGKQRAGLVLEGKIDRTEFGLKWNKLIEAGGVAVSDTVKIIIELEGIVQD